MQSAAEATKKLTSAHVAVVVTGKFDQLGPVSAVDADIQSSPLIANGEVSYDSGTKAPMVVADDIVSVKTGDQWGEVGSTSTFVPPQLLDPSIGLPAILDSVTDLGLQGSETIDGTKTTKVTGTMPADRAEEFLPGAAGPADFTASMRDGADPVLVRAVIDFSGDRSLEVTLSKWNAPVQVTAAPAA